MRTGRAETFRRMPGGFIRSSRQPGASAPPGFPGPERMKRLLRVTGRLHYPVGPQNGLTPTRFRLGRLAFLCHAGHVTVGCKLDPISALHKSSFPVVTELGAMACQGRRWIYVRLGQGLRCKCGDRSPDQKHNKRLFCSAHGSSPFMMLRVRTICSRDELRSA